MRGFPEALLLLEFTLLPSLFVNGLLVSRQGFCDPSFVICEATGCCPIGWNCCNDGSCCDPTMFCDINDANNLTGCCSIGAICGEPVPPFPEPITTSVLPPTQTLPPPPPKTTATPPSTPTASSSDTVGGNSTAIPPGPSPSPSATLSVTSNNPRPNPTATPPTSSDNTPVTSNNPNPTVTPSPTLSPVTSNNPNPTPSPTSPTLSDNTPVTSNLNPTATPSPTLVTSNNLNPNPTATPSPTLSNNTPVTSTSNNPNPTDVPPPTASTTTAASGQVTGTSSNILTVPLPEPTITATATQAIAPIPTAAVAQIPDSSTVNSTSPIIQYQGIWTPANSSCDSTVSSMKTQDPLSYLSYRFKVLDNGQVYMGSSRNQDAGVFVVALDNVQTEIDGFSTTAESSCSFTWSQSNLSKGYHNLTVSYVGTSPQSQVQGQSGSFELNNFQLVGQDTSPVQSGGMSIHGGVSSSAVTVFFAVLQVGLFLA